MSLFFMATHCEQLEGHTRSTPLPLQLYCHFATGLGSDSIAFIGPESVDRVAELFRLQPFLLEMDTAAGRNYDGRSGT